METDDEIYRVDDLFLGPPGTRLPFTARYRALGIGGCVAVTMLVLEVLTGTISVIGAVWALFLAYVITTLAMRYIDYERSIRSALTALWHEVTAPRRRKKQPTTYRSTTANLRRPPKA